MLKYMVGKPDIILKKLISINPASIWKFFGDKHLEGFIFGKKIVNIIKLENKIFCDKKFCTN